MENPKANFPLANGDDESVHAQQAGSAPIDLSKIVEDGFAKYGLNGLLHIGSSKTEPVPSVHANGGIATPPEYAQRKTDAELTTSRIGANPPSAQAAVSAAAQNGQLRVLSSLADLEGVRTSAEVVDRPCALVSAKKRVVSRKAEKVDSPEEIQRKADHVTLMDTLHTRTGQPILNGGAQAGAIKRILGAYTVEQAIEVLDSQLAGNWRGPVSWLSVQTQIADYFRRKEQSQTKLGGNNGKSKFEFFDICNNQPFAIY